MSTTAIVRYNAGNVLSVQLALERLGATAVVTDDPAVIRAADRVILPGVGEAKSAMTYLREHNLDALILSLQQPVLGICLGMQLFCNHTEEGDTAGVQIFKANVKKFPAGLKIPHMGWNTLDVMRGPLFQNVDPGSYVYFVHSFYAESGGDAVATTHYGLPFCSALQKNNFFGVQFHPEKSATVGETILKNFIAL